MKQINEFVDERQKQWCVHCGQHLSQTTTNRDHIPSKSLLCRPFPDQLPVLEICQSCNSSFSDDEMYTAALLDAVLSGSTKPELQLTDQAAKRLNSRPKLSSKLERARREYFTLGGEKRIHWKPDLRPVKRVVVKNAKGHAMYEFGEPMIAEPDVINVTPLLLFTSSELDQFENGHADQMTGWPEVGSRMLERVITGKDLHGKWVVVQDGRYRYSVSQEGIICVRSVLCEYLATEVIWT